jgi:transcriptional regulator with XRE-family HTH domain
VASGGKKKNPILGEFAKKVRMRRHELRLTQEELAEQAGFHVNFVGGIERANRNPSLTSLIKLAEALRLNPRELLP